MSDQHPPGSSAQDPHRPDPNPFGAAADSSEVAEPTGPTEPTELTEPTEPTVPLPPTGAEEWVPIEQAAADPTTPPATASAHDTPIGPGFSVHPGPDGPVIHPPAPGYPTQQLTADAPVRRSAPPAWAWLLLGLLSLVLGVGGGAIGASLIQAEAGPTPVLQVPERTAVPLAADNNSVAAVAAKMLPSTVQILAATDERERGATGSGWVLDDRGHVVTNNHVIAEAAADTGRIVVIDHEGRRLDATVVGASAVYDIAVLKADGAQTIPPASIGSSHQMRVGETVVAFGSPLGLSATVTSGIISALERPVTTGNGDDSSFINAIQTDAAINPGNSGGPLTDLQGQVIGVNSAIASMGSPLLSDERGNIGVGFAIPIEQVRVTAEQILSTGQARYPVIGANIRGTDAMDGAVVEGVVAGSGAAKANLRVGDVITKVEGRAVTGSIDVVVAIRSHQPGETVELTVRRGGKEATVGVRLQARTG